MNTAAAHKKPDAIGVEPSLDDRVKALEQKGEAQEAMNRNLESQLLSVLAILHPDVLFHPETVQDYRAIWSLIKTLRAKKEWTFEEIGDLVSRTVLLTELDLKKMSQTIKTPLCWLLICELLRDMFASIVTQTGYRRKPELVFLARRVQSTLIKLDSAATLYLMIHDPEVKDFIQNRREHYLDLIPDPAIVHYVPTHQLGEEVFLD
jgi:hypothetical protein